MGAMLAAQNTPQISSATVSGLPARNIGSATMSGRIAAVAGVNQDGRITLFVGSASGGVWKSVNGGTTFKPVFDRQDVQSIGAVAIDPSNPKNVWVGTGESWMRNSVSVGDGIYKSTDGGEDWENVGLKGSEHISKILIDPKDGNRVLACATGHAWNDSDTGGVYRTTTAARHGRASGGRERVDWLRHAGGQREKPFDRLCLNVGLPAARVDVPLGRAGQRNLPLRRRRQSLDRADHGQQQGPA